MFERLGESTVHEGHIWRVVVATFAGPDGERFHRDIVRSPGAVGVVAFDHRDGSVLLVRQYRPPLEADLLEIPAGMRDVPGELPEETARRELIEEAGCIAESLQLLTVMHPSAGMTDSTTHVFLATGLSATEHDRHGPEEAHMTVERWSLEAAVDAVAAGVITDAKTAIGLLLADRRLRPGPSSTER